MLALVSSLVQNPLLVGRRVLSDMTTTLTDTVVHPCASPSHDEPQMPTHCSRDECEQARATLRRWRAVELGFVADEHEVYGTAGAYRRIVGAMFRLGKKLAVDRQGIHLAINIFTRYVARPDFKNLDVGMEAATALFIADKYEDDIHVGIYDCLHLAGFGRSDAARERMERVEVDISIALGFQFTVPTAYMYVCMLETMYGRPLDAAHKLLDKTVRRLELVGARPSVVAACVVFVANGRVWDDVLAIFSGYAETEVAAYADTYFHTDDERG